MNLRPLFAAAWSALSLFPVGLLAQAAPAPAAAPLAATAPAAPDAEQAIAAELSALVGKVKAKLEAGQATEAALTEELQAFDALIAKHRGAKSEAAATVGLMKARLYLEVFENEAKGIELLKQVKVDFPASQIAGKVDDFVASLEAKAVAEAATAVGKTFAPFSERDLDGKPLELAAYKGKVVLIDFWATWCGPCVRELPNVIAAYDKYHAQGFEIIGISLDKDRAALDAFIKEHKLAWPQFFDGKGWQNKLAQAYGIQSIPATFLLDAEGKIVAKGLRGDALSAKVGELLGAK